MDPEIEARLEELRQSKYIELELAYSLNRAAEDLRETAPQDCLRIRRVLARHIENFRAGTIDEKIGFFIRASDLGWELDNPDSYIDYRCAHLNAEKGNHGAAGHYFRRAARSFAKEIRLGRKKPDEWEIESGLLREAESHFVLAGLGVAASDCHYERMILIRNRHSCVFERAKGWFLWALWGWGERPWRVVGCAALLIVLYAIGYSLVGIEPRGYNRWEIFGNALYLSVITFTTLGYGDYHPINAIGKILSATEAVLGIFFTGLFLVTFVKKYTG